MKRKLVAMLAMSCLTFIISGCYTNLDGRSRGGDPFAKDSIEGRYERPVDQVYAAARKVLEFNGTLRGDNTITKTLEARVNTRRVWIRIDEVEPNITRVIVQARTNGGGGDVDLAAELEKQVALQLK